jgi:hypothetical protein
MVGGEVRHVWVRRNYGKRWMPGLVIDWRQHETTTSSTWEALCIVFDRERSWVEWFGLDELAPIATDPPAITN